MWSEGSRGGEEGGGGSGGGNWSENDLTSFWIFLLRKNLEMMESLLATLLPPPCSSCLLGSG